MAYIGQRPVIGRYIKLDQISSGFNGSNTGFSMTAGSQAVFPGTARNLLLSLGGVIQEPDTDFTISGSTLTFTTAPVANTTFFGVIYGDMQATGTPSDGTVLPASIASSGHFKIPQLTVNEDGADVDFRVEGDTEANLLFVDASTDRVGIGTNSPAFKLHVNGTSRFGSTRINSTTESVDGAFNDLVIGDYSSNRGISILSGATGQGAVGFAKSGTTADGYLAYVHNGTATSSAMTLKSQGHIKFNAGSTTKLYIEHDGNVGIGTTSPEDLLHIKSGKIRIENAIVSNNDSTISYDNSDFLIDVDPNNVRGSSQFQIKIDTVAGLTIDDNRNVGIGTTSPIGTLDVHDGTFVLSKPSSSGNERNYRFVNNNAAAGNLGLQVSTAAAGSTFSNLVELSSGGRLMIGTTTIVGSSRANTPGLQIKDTIGNAFDNHIYLEGASTNGNADTGAALGFGGHDGTTARNWAQICGKKENGTSGSTSSYMSFATRRSGVNGINEKYRITSMGSLTTAQSSQSVIGRDWTSGSLAAGATINYDGSGGANTNSKLNFNSIGGNGGGHITCLSISSQDQNPSGAMIIAGVHGQGFNSYDTLLNNFDSGISVTFNGTVTIQNTSSETIYYAVNVIHLGTGNTTYLGR